MAELATPLKQGRSGPHPGARRAVGAVWLESGFLIHGGFGRGGQVAPDAVFADLWQWQQGWSILAEDGPPPARYPSLCADGSGGFWRFGGCGYGDGGPTFIDTLWHWDAGWKQVEVVGDQPAGRYTSALVRHGGDLMVFGGFGQSDAGDKVFHGDLWRFTDGRWEQLHGPETGPGPRYGFGWTADATGLCVFGGYDGSADLADLWSLDLATLRWTLLAEAGPAPRYCPALGFAAGSLVLSGGRSKTDSRANYSDTWRFDGAWHQLDLDGPGYHAKAAVASGTDALWLFGGEGPRGHVSDTWMFDGDAWTCLEPASDDDPILW